MGPASVKHSARGGNPGTASPLLTEAATPSLNTSTNGNGPDAAPAAAMPPVRRLARNAGLSLLNSATSLLSGLILLPLTFHRFGTAMFGVLALATALSAYASMLDLGFNVTLTKRVAECKARGDLSGGAAVSAVASTMMVVYIGIGVVAGLSLLAFAIPEANPFSLAPNELGIFRSVLAILALQTALSFPLSVWNSVLCGWQDYHLLYVCSMIASLGRLVAALVLLGLGIGVVPFVWLSFATTMALWLSNYVVARVRIPQLRISFTRFSWIELRQCAVFSGSMVVWSVAGYSLHQGDRVILGFATSPAGVAVYDVGARLAVYSRALIHSVLDILLPHAADFQASGRGGLGSLYLHATRLIVFAYGALVVCVLTAGQSLMTLWLGPGHTTSTTVLTLLLLANLVQAQTAAGHVLLVGTGKLRAFTRLMAGYPLVVGSAGLLLAETHGATGMATAVLISVTLIETAFIIVLVRSFHIPALRLLRTCQLPAAIGLGLGWLAGHMTAMLLGRPSLGSALVSATVALAAYTALVLALGINSVERRRALGLLPRPARRPSHA